jgi:hypothetical protein
MMVQVPACAAVGDQSKSPLADKLGSAVALPVRPDGKVSE